MTEFSFEDEKARSTNRTAPPTDCDICGGDRFVVVSLRRPEQTVWMREKGITTHPTEMIEEYGPCPLCGPDLGPRYIDKGKVLERLQR